jgi:hypothetical protein
MAAGNNNPVRQLILAPARPVPLPGSIVRGGTVFPGQGRPGFPA